MKKIIDFIKKNYIVFTVIAVSILILIASLVIIGIIKNNRHKIVTYTENVELYQYLSKKKKGFKAKVYYEDGRITKIETDNYNILNSPIYYEKDSKVILPNQNELVFYYRNNLSYRLPKYSTLRQKDSALIINSEGNNYHIDNFFISDGSDTYVLPNESVLTVDGKEISLSALSFVVANRVTLLYYDYALDKMNILENVKVANLHINNADVDLLNDMVVYNKKTSLIVNDIDSFETYKED